MSGATGVPPPGLALADGQELILLGTTAAELGGSEWASVVHAIAGGQAPEADLVRARDLHELVAGLVRDRLVAAVHDCADGGLAVTIAEMSIAGGVGVTVELGASDDLRELHPATALFSESASRVVVAVPVGPQATAGTAAMAEVVSRAREARAPMAVIGRTGGTRFVVNDAQGAAAVIDLSVTEITDTHREAIPRLMATAPGR